MAHELYDLVSDIGSWLSRVLPFVNTVVLVWLLTRPAPRLRPPIKESCLPRLDSIEHHHLPSLAERIDRLSANARARQRELEAFRHDAINFESMRLQEQRRARISALKTERLVDWLTRVIQTRPCVLETECQHGAPPIPPRPKLDGPEFKEPNGDGDEDLPLREGTVPFEDIGEEDEG